MRLSSDFWFNYPIFLPDHEQFNYVQDEFIAQQSSPRQM